MSYALRPLHPPCLKQGGRVLVAKTSKIEQGDGWRVEKLQTLNKRTLKHLQKMISENTVVDGENCVNVAGR